MLEDCCLKTGWAAQLQRFSDLVHKRQRDRKSFHCMNERYTVIQTSRRRQKNWEIVSDTGIAIIGAFLALNVPKTPHRSATVSAPIACPLNIAFDALGESECVAEWRVDFVTPPCRKQVLAHFSSVCIHSCFHSDFPPILTDPLLGTTAHPQPSSP